MKLAKQDVSVQLAEYAVSVQLAEYPVSVQLAEYEEKEVVNKSVVFPGRNSFWCQK